jgi:hypothetical protein
LRTDSTSSFDLLDQAALHQLGELDFADELRQPDLRAHHRPAGAAILPLFAGRRPSGRFVELLFELLNDRALLADGVDLLQHFLRPLVDALVGDLVVLEDHELADGAGAGLQLIAHRDDHLRDGRRARDRLDDGELAALDAPRDSTSPSRVSSGTVPISRRYMRTGSLVLSSAPGVRSSSISSLPSAVRSNCFSWRYVFSESTTSMPALPNVLNKSSSSSDEVISAGSNSLTFVVQQIAFFLPDRDQLPYFVVFFFNRQAFLLLPRTDMITERSPLPGLLSEIRSAIRAPALDLMQKMPFSLP